MKKVFFLIAIILPVIGNCQCFVSGLGSLGRLSKTTGNSYVDNWFNSQKSELEKVFDVEADLYIYDDGNSPNAYATKSNWVNGQIAFGKNLLVQYLWRMDKGSAGIAAILAHEYAHVLQQWMGSKLSWKYRELHADFLAGYYLHTRNYITYSNLNIFASTFFELGDDAFWSPSHHGNKYERLEAFKAGFNCNAEDIYDAMDAGEEYLLN